MRFDIINCKGVLGAGIYSRDYSRLATLVCAGRYPTYESMVCKWRIDMDDETINEEEQRVEELPSTPNIIGNVLETTHEIEAIQPCDNDSVSVPGYNFISIEAV